jgi:hypothetical protein
MQTAAASDGSFEFPLLEPGKYRIEVDAPGFAAKVLDQFELTVAEQAEQIIRLDVASAGASIVVKAGEEGARVQTGDAQISRNITMREIETLPLPGMDPIELVFLQPGISTNGTYSVTNGTRITSTNLMVDGIYSGNSSGPYMALNVLDVNANSIEEFHVVTSGGKAEYGRNSGAQIEMLTRSGSNRFTGNLSDYFRNSALDANSFFSNLAGIGRPFLVRNIFGGSIGGPVRKNRTFFFANYQGTRIRGESAVNSVVLTDSAKAGIFRWRAPGSTQISSFDIVASDPRHLGIDPTIATYLAQLPEANLSGIGDGLNTSGFRYNGPHDLVEDSGNLKLDHNLTDSHHLFFRFSQGHTVLTDVIPVYPNKPQGQEDYGSGGFSAGSDWVLTPRLVNSLRVGTSGFDTTVVRPRPNGPVYANLLFTSPVSNTFPSGGQLPQYDISDSLAWVKGKHTVKGGFRFQPSSVSTWNDAGIYPTVNLNPLLSSAIGPSAASVISTANRNTFVLLYDELLGRINSVQQTFYSNDLSTYLPPSSQLIRKRHYHDFSAFLQDDWRVARGLTVNYGLRWEYMSPPQLDGAATPRLDPANMANGVTPYQNFQIVAGRAINPYYHAFAPRIGLAWDPFGDGKTAIRAAWGIYYDRLPGADFSVADQNPGNGRTVTVVENAQGIGDYRIVDGIPAAPVPSAVNLALPVNQANGFIFYEPNLRRPYTMQMSFTIEREIVRRTLLDVAYVGGRGVQLVSAYDYAQVNLRPDFLQSFREMQAYESNGTQPPASNVFVRVFGSPAAALTAMNANNVKAGAAGTVAENLYLGSYSRFTAAGFPYWYFTPYPQFAQLHVAGNEGRSYYDGLQMSLRRSAGNLRLALNYTWSKSIDNRTITDTEGTLFNYLDPRDTRGLSDTNIPHTFTAIAAYSIPVGRGQRFASHLTRALNMLLGNWDLGLINRTQSGLPFTVNSGYSTTTTINTAGNRADTSMPAGIGQVQRSGNGVSFFTPQQIASFSTPAPGMHGASQRNGYQGPMSWNTNLSLAKRFPVTERLHLLFRAEAYNALNRANFGLPNATVSSPNFGQITSMNSSVTTPSDNKVAGVTGRVMQLALRLDF